MSPIHIDLTPDKMEARLTISVTGDNFPTREAIQDLLQQAGVILGVDDQTLDTILKQGKPVENRIVARGKPAVSSTDTKIIWYVSHHGNQASDIDANQRIDYKSREEFEFVKKGSELASLLPPENAAWGKTVTGEPASPLPPNLDKILGENLEISPDGLSLLATKDGYVLWRGERISVNDIFTFDGDVDFHTGNIRFNGSIQINGDVKSGFRVEATGDIHIKGSVDAATIYSSEGDIVITQGVLGKQRAKLLAEGSIYCGFIQDASVVARRDVTVQGYVINSQISAGGKVHLTGNPALIRGGEVFAEDGIEADEVGAERVIPTRIGLTNAELREATQEQDALRDQLELFRKEFNLIDKKIDFLRLLQQRVGNLTPAKQKELKDALVKKVEYEQRITQLTDEIRARFEKAREFHPQKLIRVHQHLYRGVTITIGNQAADAANNLKNVNIYLKNNAIHIEPAQNGEDENES
ncbi:MAG: FapA family protein [Candidatus Marinimicrobia bacterium]|nr:FapA family protein [Candidatus Neomarinimicrobiota bacterium]MCF7841070.1 FapA family protein [Candidatus Neomarinimicrobiota bacterium]MCF7902293.1 FapA family protein [Candidatus Neomarinimicrobiota bacterium]